MLYEEALKIINRALAPDCLNPLQSNVLRMSLENKTYCQMLQDLDYAYTYITDVGSELWQLLSEKLGTKVTKLKLSSVLRDAEQKHMCNTLTSSQPKVDWGEAPDTSQLSGRQAELETLNRWVLQDCYKVVAVAGSGGIGKTTLATQSAQQLADTGQFDVVVWRSLRQAPLLRDFLTELVSAIAPEQLIQTAPEVAMRQLLEQLRARRCLLILDNVETVLAPNEFAGSYQPGYKNYGWLFQQLGEVQHQSSVLLTCREIPPEVATHEGTTTPIRLLKLESLSVEDGENILATKGLLPAELSQTQEVIKRYEGNPLVLKIVATIIKELFDGSIADFLVAKETLLFKEIYELLAQQFNRLSLIERQVMYWLAIHQEAVTAAQLEANLLPFITRVELQDALVSLTRRSLIKKIKPPSANPTALMSLDSVSYTQQPLVMTYVQDQLIQETCQEAVSVQKVYLKSHALLKAQVENYQQEVLIGLIRQLLLAQLIYILRALSIERLYEDTNIPGVERIKVCTKRDTTSSGCNRKLTRGN